MNRPVDAPIPAAPVPAPPPAAAPAAGETAGRAVLRHSTDLLWLAWPVMLSRVGILAMAFVDIAMLGRYGLGAPGVLGLGLAVFMPVMVCSIGLVLGVVPVVSRAWGAGDRAEAGRAWRRAMRWATLVSVIGIAPVWASESLLRLLDYPPEMSAGAGRVARALAPGLVAQVLFTACALYLEATRRPLYALGAMVVANVVNAGLNWVLIFGNLGAPELGATGAALATSVARFAALGAMLAFILCQRDPRGAGVIGPLTGWSERLWGPGGWRAGAPMRRLGASAGISIGFETIGFAVLMLMAGTLGTAALDAYSIAHNLVATAFMVGLGLSVATGVRVAQAAGAGDLREAALAGWTGVLVTVVIVGALAAGLLGFRHQIVLAYTDVPLLAERVAALFVISALIFLPDSLQVVLGQAVRALGDAWVPVAAYILCFVVMMVPLGWLLTGPLGWDERGLALAVAAACALATALLGWRFHLLTRPGAGPAP